VRLAIFFLLVVYTDAIEYIVSKNRYDIYEDFGPVFSLWNTPLTFVFFRAWPVAIGTISFFYCGEYS
jgi:pheromone a factor receptor